MKLQYHGSDVAARVRRLLVGAVTGVTLGAFLGLAAGPAAADSLSDLKQQVEALQKKIEQLEAKQAKSERDAKEVKKAAKKVASAKIVTEGDFPGSFKIQGTDLSVKIGGYAKLDAIYDADAIGVEDLFVPSSIVTDRPGNAQRDGRTRFHARQSRLNFDARAPSPYGQFRAFIEGDFFGGGGNQNVTNSTSLRIRHAFGQLGNLLAGQTWTTFMDASALPETLDFEGPNGEIFVRQAQIRWTQPFKNGLTIAAALENPEGDIFQDGNLNLDQAPDGILRARWKQDWGHLQAGALVRDIRIDTGNGTATLPARAEDSAIGWGVNLSGKFALDRFGLGKDDFRFQANYGDGISRYIVDIGGGDGTFNAATQDLNTLKAFGGYAAYRHWWTDSVRSTATYGYVNVVTDRTQPATTFDNSQYVQANLIWSPIKRVNLGVEYLYGEREDRDGANGQASRVQLSGQFNF